MTEQYITIEVKVEDLLVTCQKLLAGGGRMVMAYGWQPPGQAMPEILYLGARGDNDYVLWRCQLEANQTPPSLANEAPLLNWYEREMMDLLGMTFSNHPEPYPLVLHEGADCLVPPLGHYKQDALLHYEDKRWSSPELDDPDLQHLPYGPIRAAVVESAQFDFLYAGETIVHFTEKLFFKHRGMEKKFCGLSPELGVILAERVSGIGSGGHAIAFSQAVEAAAQCQVPALAAYSRVIVAELERLYNHLHFFGHLCSATTLKVAAAEGKLLEERFKQLNAKVTGSRFLRGIIAPGGLRRPLCITDLEKDLLSLKQKVDKYFARLLDTNSHIDRLLNTGVVTSKLCIDEGATGPTERAAGVINDLRSHHSYGVYDQLKFEVPTEQEGDANARSKVRMRETEQSIELILQALQHMSGDKIKSDCPAVKNSFGLAWAESPRGGLFYGVHFDEAGLLSRVKVKSPSYSNWRVFPFTVQGSGIMDFAINEASFGLSVAGCDR